MFSRRRTAPAVAAQVDGRSHFIAGSSRSGKTALVRELVAGAPRLLVWDIEAQYVDLAIRIEDQAELVEAIRAGPAGPQRIAFVPRRLAWFGWWARLAFIWGRMAPGVVVAEEIADVTSAGKAPEGWGILLRRALKHGIDIYTITQRPQESDKTSLGNASTVTTFRLTSRRDRAYMADRMGLDLAELPTEPLVWIRTDDAGGVARGRLKF